MKNKIFSLVMATYDRELQGIYLGKKIHYISPVLGFCVMTCNQKCLGSNSIYVTPQNTNGWQFVGDGDSLRFIEICCSNGQLCLAELVHWLLYILRLVQHVISRYVYIYIYIYIYIYRSVNTTLINSNWWNVLDFTFPYTAVYSQFTVIYLLHNITIHALR
jgi:hypothetical protein